jgi:hypothetical protein
MVVFLTCAVFLICQLINQPFCAPLLLMLADFFQKKPMTEERANEKSEERRVPKMTGDREAGWFF